MRGVAVEQAHDPLARLGGPRDHLGPARVRQRLPVLAEAGVEHLDPARAPPRDELVALLVADAAVEHDRLGAGEHLGGAHRQQAGVTRAGADEGHLAGRLVLAAHCSLSCTAEPMRTKVCSGFGTPAGPVDARPRRDRRRRPRAGRAASRRPRPPGSDAGPVAERRRSSEPSGASATARRYSSASSPACGSPSTQSASAPTGAEHPASSPASRARSAVDARRGSARRRARPARPRWRRRRRGTRRRARPGRAPAAPGQRVEHLGDVRRAGRSGPGRPGPARRRRPRRRRPGRAGCRRCRAPAPPAGRARGRAAARPGAATRCRPRRPRRARRGSGRRRRPARRAGPRAAAPRPARSPGAGAVGRSLSECTARSTSPASSASRSADDEHAGAADLGERGGRGVAVRCTISTSSTSWPWARSASATCSLWVRASRLPAGAEAQGAHARHPARARSPGTAASTSETSVMVAPPVTASMSRSNSSRRAAA